MQIILVTAFAAMAVISDTISAFNLPEAGNCNMRCNIPLVPLTTEMFEAYRPWKVLYVTNAAWLVGIDGEHRDGVRVRKGMYWVTDTFKMKDNSEGEFKWMLTIVDNIIIENGTEHGKTHTRYSYPIAITNEYGLLFHHCDPDGSADEDTRYIWIPHNVTLSDAGLKYLMEVDEKCNCRGELHKLSDAE